MRESQYQPWLNADTERLASAIASKLAGGGDGGVSSVRQPSTDWDTSQADHPVPSMAGLENLAAEIAAHLKADSRPWSTDGWGAGRPASPVISLQSLDMDRISEEVRKGLAAVETVESLEAEAVRLLGGRIVDALAGPLYLATQADVEVLADKLASVVEDMPKPLSTGIPAEDVEVERLLEEASADTGGD